MILSAGSAYTYCYVALGEIIGWFIGWDLLLEYIAIVAVVVIGISGYFTEFMSGIGVTVPLWMQGTPDAIEGGAVNVPAIAVCLLITFILSRGTKTFGKFELIAVELNILLILGIVGLGFFYVNAENYSPFLPSGFGAVFTGAVRDGLLPAWFSTTDRNGTPQHVTRIAGVASALFAGVLPIPRRRRPHQYRDPRSVHRRLHRGDRATPHAA